MPFRIEQPDDSDMKIARFNSPVKKIQRALQEAEESEYIRNKENGNLGKARRLGEELAKLALEYEKSMTWGLFIEDEGGSLASQKRILMCFSLSSGLREYTPNSYISNTAQSIFYDRIKESAPCFYADIHESGGYSFYYLDFRRGGEVERSIGRTFAMLCGQDGNSVYSELGEVLYCRFFHEVRKIALTYDFAG